MRDDDDYVEIAADGVEGGPTKATFIVAFFPTLAAVFGTLVLVSKLRGRHVQLRLEGVGEPYYWSSAGGSDSFLILLVAVVGLLGIIFCRERLWFKLSAGALLLWALALVLWISSGAYFTIVGTRVTSFSEWPWRPPVTFDLRHAQIVKRGCYHRGGKHSRDTAKFVVRDPATGTTVNLASGMNAYDAAGWVRIMQPYVSGEIPLAEGDETDRDTSCLSAKAQLLDPEKRVQMGQLLKTKDVTRLGW